MATNDKSSTSTAAMTKSDGGSHPSSRNASRKNRNRARKGGSSNRSQDSQRLDQSFLQELAAARDAENQLIKALPRIASAVQEPELRRAVQRHLGETKGHLRCVDAIFNEQGRKPKEQKNPIMASLLAEAGKILRKGRPSAGRDALIIAAAQKVEHYEIATYGSLAAWCRVLRNGEALERIEDILREEKVTDQELSRIAEDALNYEAISAGANSGREESSRRGDGNPRRGGSARSGGQQRYQERGGRRTEQQREYGFEDETLSQGTRGFSQAWDQNRPDWEREDYGRFGSAGRATQQRQRSFESGNTMRGAGEWEEGREGRRSRQDSPERDEYGRFEREGRQGRGSGRNWDEGVNYEASGRGRGERDEDGWREDEERRQRRSEDNYAGRSREW